MTNSTSIKRKYEVLFFPKINRAVRRIYKDVTDIIETNGVQAAINYLNTQIANPELTVAINQLYGTVGVGFANISYNDLKRSQRGLKRPIKSVPNNIETKAGGAFGFNSQWVDWITNYLRQHLIQNITFNVIATTKEHLLQVLSKSIEQGLGIDETIRLLNDDTFSETQAARIVRTEVNMASNAGTLAAGETYEYQMKKEWIAVTDNRTRGVNPKDHASHIGLNGAVIDFEDVFTDPRNGDRLRSPGDPNARAESIINCRCQLGLKPKVDSNGRLIPKRRSTVVIFPDSGQRRRLPTITI